MSERLHSVSAERSNWTFDGISDRFEAHIEKSVPPYHEGHDLICRYSDFFVRDDSVVYELGSATGTLGRKLTERNQQRQDLRYVGLDAVQTMVDHANEHAAGAPRESYLVGDIVDFDFEPATVVISYYTLQFIHPAHRQDVVRRVFDSLEWGGAFFLFEKVRGPDARFQDYASQVYTDVKMERGFSPAEVLNKTDSLKGVLEPFSTQGNVDLMRRAGFVDITTIQKWVCFEGWLAIK